MIVEWLNAYLIRTSETGYTSDDAEVNDLIALDDFLGVYRVRVSGDSGRLSRASPTQSHAPPSRKKGRGWRTWPSKTPLRRKTRCVRRNLMRRL